MKKEITRSERLRMQLLFGLFGLGMMALAPRSPDLKHNLGVSNGFYGLLVSLGAIGSVTSLLVMGRLVQKIGIRPTLYITACSFYPLIAYVPHIHSPLMYGFVNVFLALTISAHNTALTAHCLNRADESGEMLLPRMHGSWSIGVLFTVLLALFLTSRVSFAVHIDTLTLFVWLLTLILIKASSATIAEKSSEKIAMEKVNLARFRKIFTFDKSVIVAFALGTIIEFASGDWATLVTNQEIHAKKNISILAFLALISGMILGRMYFVKIIKYRSERFWIRLASIAGGVGFIVFSQLAWFLAGKKSSFALPTEVVAFFIAGLGTSFFSPLFTTIANRRSSLKPSEVVSQLNFTNAVLAFCGKLVISWVAQVTSITIALLIPGICLLLVSRFAYLGHPHALADEF